MGFSKSTQELKTEVLELCGELTDGQSEYEGRALKKLNDLYQGLLAGGNEFGISTAEPWTWAQARRPIIIELLPSYKTGTVTLTQASASGTFSTAPTLSMKDRYLKINDQPDRYKIATHIAGSSTFTLDQTYQESSGIYNFEALKLDYDLYDDTIIIDETSQNLDFRESTNLTAVIPQGSYTPASLCTAVAAAMNAVSTTPLVYTVSFNSITRIFRISTSAAFSLMFASGANVDTSISETMGFNFADLNSVDFAISASIPISAITRLTKPATMYREAPMYIATNKDVGKIFLIDDNTFLREYPITRLVQDMPDKMCLMAQTHKGLWKVRFNAVVEEPVRVEINYIPVTRPLADNSASYPRVPGAAADYLKFGAAHFLLLDKSDNKADTYLQLATAKLKAMVNDNRKNMSLAGVAYGRLIPRRGQIKIWGWKS